MSDERDRALGLLLAEEARAPDEVFVGRIRWAVVAEERMRAERRGLWRRLAVEAAATFALVASYFMLARAAPIPAGFIPLSSPALAGPLLLALGMIVIAVTPPLKNHNTHQ